MSPYYHGFIYSFKEGPTLFSGATDLSEIPEGKYYFSSGWLPEGSQVYVQLLTLGVASGTELYWRAEGAGIDENDFKNNAKSGSAIVRPRSASDGWDGEITFTHAFKNDLKTEENYIEYLRYYIYADNSFSSPLGNTDNQVGISDTSIDPPNSRVVSWQQEIGPIVEGRYQRLVTINAPGVLSGFGRLQYKFFGDGVTPEDFFVSGNPSEESIGGEAWADNNGRIVISHGVQLDRKTEGSEKVYIQLYERGVKVGGQLPYFEIKDTSMAPDYQILGPETVREGEDLKLSIRYRGMPDGSTSDKYLRWTLRGNAFDEDDIFTSRDDPGGHVRKTKTLVGAFSTGSSHGRDNSNWKNVDLVWGIKNDQREENNTPITFSLRRGGKEVARHKVLVIDDGIKESGGGAFNIGDFKISYGGNEDNFKYVEPGYAFFGRGGDDDLRGKGYKEVVADGATWITPSILSGGKGNDTYHVGYNNFSFIIDADPEKGKINTVQFGTWNGVRFFTVDSRHLLIYTSRGDAAFVIDGLREEGFISRYRFGAREVDIDFDDIDSFLKARSAPDYSFEELIEIGAFNPSLMGMDSADAVRDKIDEIYDQELSLTAAPVASPSYLRNQVIQARTWSAPVRINRDVSGNIAGPVLQAKQVDKSEYDSGFVGSIVNGTSDDDIVRGLAGFDQLFGQAGDDLIHGGNGRDIIDGGSGSDELHGDFGWNTFLDQQDGSKDLIAIKSDQHLSNFWYGKAGNSPNGEKADFIEGLDTNDEIKIIGVFTPDISVVDNVTARGVTGIGIYAKGTLEAVYTGGNLSTSQIQNMTTGDGSTTAMNNRMWSYWGENTVPALQS